MKTKRLPMNDFKKKKCNFEIWKQKDFQWKSQMLDKNKSSSIKGQSNNWKLKNTQINCNCYMVKVDNKF